MKKLILFDIDGTLITDDGAAREAYSIALREVFGHHGSLRPYDFSGRTDPQITHMVLGDAGFDRALIDEKLPELWEIYTGELAARATAGRIRVFDGVVELLERLALEKNAVLALLTGNIERGARIKLEAPQLNRHFTFGAFGSDHADRNELPPVAVARARQLLEHDFGGRNVVVIGDSIYDVRCAAPHGATAIAVATGKTSAETLRAEQPHHLFDSLQPTDQLLAAILE